MTIPVETRSKCIKLYYAIYESGLDIFNMEYMELNKFFIVDEHGFTPTDELYQLMVFHFLMFINNAPSDFEISFIEEMNTYFNTHERWRYSWRPRTHLYTQHPLGHVRRYLTSQWMGSIKDVTMFYNEMSKLVSLYDGSNSQTKTIKATNYMDVALRKEYYIQSLISAFG